MSRLGWALALLPIGARASTADMDVATQQSQRSPLIGDTIGLHHLVPWARDHTAAEA
jgi:hypothetical protein